jgi:hypothetical protein
MYLGILINKDKIINLDKQVFCTIFIKKIYKQICPLQKR